MRIAAAILMIIVAMALPCIVVMVGEGVVDIRTFDLWLSLLIIISGVLLVAGGVACLRRRYWRLCFTAALFAIFVMILWLGLFWPEPFFRWRPVASASHTFGFHRRGDSPDDLRSSQEKRLVRISGLTAFFYEKTLAQQVPQLRL